MYDIKQFKLTSGEEIICEVVEWSTDEYSDIITRRCFTLHTLYDPDKDAKFYSFRSYMALQEGQKSFISINNNHILSEANPSKTLIKHYKDAVERSELDDIEIEDTIENLVNRLKDLQDSADDTVVNFRPKPVIH
tara:strand:+ start:3147 stop:3551 length:405 start_codon:yes stop_codon:yes gene_type:complete